MIEDAIKKLVLKENLNEAQIKEVMDEILEKRATEAQIASFLTALRMKGETAEEITSTVFLLRKKGEILNIDTKDVIDIVGTGGDGANTFNISTTTLFVVASSGLKIAKPGNRAASSKCGAADVLEALGVNINHTNEENQRIFEQTGICFMFAPTYTPILKNVQKVRKEIKIRTIFNCLGPLINPARAKMQIVGVYSKDLIEPVINSMKNLGVQKGMVLFGECGLDEGSIVSKTYYSQIKDGEIIKGEFCPEDFGLKRAKLNDIQGGDFKENALILKGILDNSIKGAKRDVVLLNSALSFYVSSKVKTIKEGIELSDKLIKNGSAYKKFIEFQEASK